MQEELVVSGDRAEWLEKCANALASSGFTKITKNTALSQIEPDYKKLTVWGTILVTLTPAGSDTKLTIVSTANVDGPVAELVGIEGGVVSGVINLESSDV